MSQRLFGGLILALLAAGFIALIAIGGMSLWLSQRAQNYGELILLTQRIENSAAQTLSVAQDAETGQRGFLLTQDPKYLEPYDNATVNLPAELVQLTALTSQNPAVQVHVAKIKDLLDKRLSIIRETIEAAKNGERQRAIDIVGSGRGKDVMDQIRVEIAGIKAEQERLYRERSDEFVFTTNALLYVNICSLVVIALLALGSVYVTRRYIHDLNGARRELEAVNQGLEKTVQERTGEILRANEEIQRFAYIVSHDLRSPLVNVMGFTSELEELGNALRSQQEAIAEKAPDLVLPEAAAALDRELPEAIGFIRASTQKMDRLINAILKLSRDGRRTLKPERVRMEPLAKNIADSVRHQAEEAGAKIDIEQMPDLVTDRLAIEQVFSNLIENAVKYLDANRPGQILVRGRENGLFVEYEIEDNGRGIEARDHDRVFELFRRAGRQDKPGEGLGLAFVKSSVRRLGGSIRLASDAGQGSTFFLKFPKTLRI